MVTNEKNAFTVLSINSFNIGSTGNIMLGIADLASENGIQYYTSCPNARSMKKDKMDKHIFIGNIFSRNLHLVFSRALGMGGCGSIISTILFLKKVDFIKPDVIHLHNLHNSYINIPLLFKYIKKNNIRVIWTLHDCWSFTGQCPHFLINQCNRWIDGCFSCSSCKNYPESFVDNSKLMWKLKKRWFTGVKDMTIVTPSKWLRNLVKDSFLKDYSVRVINNGIDLNIFTPTKSDFREKYGVNNKKIILGVSFSWGYSKGLDVFIELSKLLPQDYVIVLVGTNDKIDIDLPNTIISIHKTNNQKELAEIYSTADVFVNPTREDTYPTVNMEAIACGTPVVTFDTGGSPEIIKKGTGKVVNSRDVFEFMDAIYEACELKRKLVSNCRIIASDFDKQKKFLEYIKLYNKDEVYDIE